jgi:hypothetical protein
MITTAAVSWPNHSASRNRAATKPSSADAPMTWAPYRPGSAENVNGRSATSKPSDRRWSAQ